MAQLNRPAHSVSCSLLGPPPLPRALFVHLLVCTVRPYSPSCSTRRVTRRSRRSIRAFALRTSASPSRQLFLPLHCLCLCRSRWTSVRRRFSTSTLRASATFVLRLTPTKTPTPTFNHLLRSACPPARSLACHCRSQSPLSWEWALQWISPVPTLLEQFSRETLQSQAHAHEHEPARQQLPLPRPLPVQCSRVRLAMRVRARARAAQSSLLTCSCCDSSLRNEYALRAALQQPPRRCAGRRLSEAAAGPSTSASMLTLTLVVTLIRTRPTRAAR